MSNAVDRFFAYTVAILLGMGIVEVLLTMSNCAPLGCSRYGCIDDFGVTAQLRFDAAQFGHRMFDKFGL